MKHCAFNPETFQSFAHLFPSISFDYLAVNTNEVPNSIIEEISMLVNNPDLYEKLNPSRFYAQNFTLSDDSNTIFNNISTVPNTWKTKALSCRFQNSYLKTLSNYDYTPNPLFTEACGIPRVDLAIDFKGFNSKDERRAFLLYLSELFQSMQVLKSSKSDELTYLFLNDKGDSKPQQYISVDDLQTLYFGKRNKKLFLRIYEKPILDDDDQIHDFTNTILRVEFEIKPTQATTFSKIFLPFAEVYDVLAQFIPPIHGVDILEMVSRFYDIFTLDTSLTSTYKGIRHFTSISKFLDLCRNEYIIGSSISHTYTQILELCQDCQLSKDFLFSGFKAQQELFNWDLPKYSNVDFNNIPPTFFEFPVNI